MVLNFPLNISAVNLSAQGPCLVILIEYFTAAPLSPSLSPSLFLPSPKAEIGSLLFLKQKNFNESCCQVHMSSVVYDSKQSQISEN